MSHGTLPQDVRGLLRELIAIPSVNPSMAEEGSPLAGENRVVDYLEELFRAAGVDTVRQNVAPGRDNLFARLEGHRPETAILEAHTDTVSVAGMAGDPFSPVERDGRIHGRGACDDKASLAAMVSALLAVARWGTPVQTLVLAATCDEEYTFRGIHRFSEDPSVVGLTPELLPRCVACAGEPTGLDVVITHKGACRWRLIVRGLAAHSSDPSRGCNALYTAARMALAVEGYHAQLISRPPHPLLGPPTASVGVMRGGTAANIVPDLCDMLIDRRLVPGENPVQVEAEFRKLLEGVGPFELETVLADGALETPAGAEVVARALAAAQSAWPGSQVCGVQYGTNASKLDAMGIPSVVCGPGHIAQAHTIDEWVEIEQLEAATRMYERFLTDEERCDAP